MVLKSLVEVSEGNKLIVSGSWGPENKMQIKSSQLKKKKEYSGKVVHLCTRHY